MFSVICAMASRALVTEESAGALDRMNRAINGGQQVAILRATLQFHHFVVQAGEILRTFDEELVEDVEILHVRLRAYPAPQGTYRRFRWKALVDLETKNLVRAFSAEGVLAGLQAFFHFQAVEFFGIQAGKLHPDRFGLLLR